MSDNPLPALTKRPSALLSSVLGNAFFALALLLILCLIFRPEFRNPQTLCMVARQVTCVGIIALGMTFIIAGGGIDLSVGSLFAFSGVISVLCVNFLAANPQWGPLKYLPENLVGTPGGAFAVVTVVSLLAGAAGGALNG